MACHRRVMSLMSAPRPTLDLNMNSILRMEPGMRIKWDANGQKRLEREAAQQAAKQMQAVMDRVLRAGRGRSVPEVKRVLRREWRSVLGGDITDPELTLGRPAFSGQLN